MIVDLGQYLYDEHIKVGDFAKEIDVSEMALWRYRHRGRIPSPEVMIRIYDATAGAVTPNDFYDLAPLGTEPESVRDPPPEPSLGDEQGAE